MGNYVELNKLERDATNEKTGSWFYSFCTFAFLTLLYIAPEHIKIYSILYIGCLLLYTIKYINFTYVSVASVFPWIAFIALGLFVSLIYGISDLSDSIEFVISLIMGLFIQSFHNTKHSRENLLKAVFAVSVVAVIGCFLQLVFPELMLKITSVTLGAEKHQIYLGFVEYNALVGFSYQTGITGFYLGVFSGFTLCYFLFAKNASKLKKLISFMLFLASYVFILLSGKRGELVIVAILTFLILCYYYRKKAHIFLLVVFVMLVGIAVLLFCTDQGRSLLERTFGDNPLSGRAGIYEQLIEIFMDNSLLGCGFGSTLNLIQNFTNGHNIYLQVLAENGVVGLLLMLSAIIYNIVISVKTWRMTREDSKDRYTLVVCIYLESYFVSLGMISNPLYDVYPLLIYMIAMGVIHYMYINLKREAKITEPKALS